MKQLRHFLTHVSVIFSIRLRCHPDMLQSRALTRQMSLAAMEFLVIASEYGCRTIFVEKRLDSNSEGTVNLRWYERASFACLADWCSAATKMAASEVNHLHISSSMFTSDIILQWCLSFSGNPSVRFLSLSHPDMDTPARYATFFPSLALPRLQCLSVKGYILMDDLLPFLSRHPALRILQLKSNSQSEFKFPVQQYRAQCTLPSLSSLVINYDFVPAFFSYVISPNLTFLHIHFGDTRSDTPYQTLYSLASYNRIHHISLRITINCFATNCFSLPKRPYPPCVLGLTKIQVEYRHPIYSPENFVSHGVHCSLQET
jgi:hypothetical protein